MQEQKGNFVQHGYFQVKGFDMNGGDMQIHDVITSYQEGLVETMKRLNYNENLCGMISKQKDKENSYKIFIKQKTETNPSNNTNDIERCTNIFYGRRIISKAHFQERKDQYANFDYYLVNGLDMWGGDLYQQHKILSFKEALDLIKNRINFDKDKCGLIVYKGRNNYSIYLKDPNKTNPSKSKGHYKSTTIFFGKNSQLNSTKQQETSEQLQKILDISGIQINNGDKLQNQLIKLQDDLYQVKQELNQTTKQLSKQRTAKKILEDQIKKMRIQLQDVKFQKEKMKLIHQNYKSNLSTLKTQLYEAKKYRNLLEKAIFRLQKELESTKRGVIQLRDIQQISKQVDQNKIICQNRILNVDSVEIDENSQIKVNKKHKKIVNLLHQYLLKILFLQKASFLNLLTFWSEAQQQRLQIENDLNEG